MPEPRHLDPWQPKSGSSRQAAKRPGIVRWSITALLLGAALATGLGMLYPMASGDTVSAREVEHRQKEFRQSPGLTLDELPAQQASKAIARLPLEANQKAALLKAVAQPNAVAQTKAVGQPAPAAEAKQPVSLRLAQITVWDTHHHDGDVVAISSGAFRIEMPLTKAPQTVAVPVDGAAPIRIVGVRDGGGGITLGIRSADSSLLMPIMSEGQELVLPLR